MGPAEIVTMITTIGGSAGVAAAVGLPASRVLNRLVLGVGDIGTAYIERPAALIRAKTDRMIEERNADRPPDASDEARADRAFVRISAQEQRRQRNREAIAALTYEDLAGDAPNTDEEVGADFMNTFERLAEDASSEELQALFAKMLAGECRKPGTYSKATLNFMNSLDQALAAEIEGWSGLVSGPPGTRHLPEGKPFTTGRRLLSLGRLASLGLIARGVVISCPDDIQWMYEGRIVFGVRTKAARRLSDSIR